MSQLSMTYTPEDSARAVWAAELEWARRAVAVIGAKEVTFALNISASDLSDALAERPRGDKDDRGEKDSDKKKAKRALRGEWITMIRQMAPGGLQLEWLRIVMPPLGHEPKRIETLTPEQELRMLKEHLREESPGALRTFEAGLGRGHTVAGGAVR